MQKNKQTKKTQLYFKSFLDDFVGPNIKPGHWPPSYKEILLLFIYLFFEANLKSQLQ